MEKEGGEPTLDVDGGRELGELRLASCKGECWTLDLDD